VCFRYDCGVNVISYLQTSATCTNRAAHSQAMFFTPPEHQEGGSSGASRGARAPNSSLLNTLLVAIAVLDVMLHQLYEDTSNRKTVVKRGCGQYLVGAGTGDAICCWLAGLLSPTKGCHPVAKLAEASTL